MTGEQVLKALVNKILFAPLASLRIPCIPGFLSVSINVLPEANISKSSGLSSSCLIKDFMAPLFCSQFSYMLAFIDTAA